MTEFREKMTECGELEARRRRQHLRWMWSYVEERLVMMAKDIANNAAIEDLEQKVREDVISPGAGADAIIQLVIQKIKSSLLKTKFCHLITPLFSIFTSLRLLQTCYLLENFIVELENRNVYVIGQTFSLMKSSLNACLGFHRQLRPLN